MAAAQRASITYAARVLFKLLSIFFLIYEQKLPVIVMSSVVKNGNILILQDTEIIHLSFVPFAVDTLE